MKHSVLIITERYYPEKFLINDLVASLVDDGWSVRVLTQVPSYPQDRLYPEYENVFSTRYEGGVRVTRFKTVLGYRRSLFRKVMNYLLFMVRAGFYGLHESRHVENVFVYHTGPLTQALPLVFAKALYKNHTVIWTMDVWPDTVFAYGFPSKGAFAVVLKRFVRLVYRYADEVIVSSPGFSGRLSPYINRSTSVRFIPQWVPDEFMKSGCSDLDFGNEGTRFIFTGNIGRMQNLESLIRAFGYVGHGIATLYILGDGSQRDALEEIARDEGFENVRFLGSVGPSVVKSCIEACDFSVLSLTSDKTVGLTIPAKFQAYLAAGRPILVVADGEVKSIVESEGLGIVADPTDITGIVHAIRRAAGSSQSERVRWGANAMALHEKRYQKRVILDELEDVIGGMRMARRECR